MQANMNDISGGISFSPLVADSSGNFTGGLHFDLPLAAVQSFSNNALAFTAGSNALDTGFLSKVLTQSKSTVDAASQRSANLNASAISAGYGIGVGNLNLADSISQRAAQTAQYQITTQASVARYLSSTAANVAIQQAAYQASVAKYLSDNAAKTAQIQAHETSYQVQSQNKGKGFSRVIGSLLSGGLF